MPKLEMERGLRQRELVIWEYHCRRGREIPRAMERRKGEDLEMCGAGSRNGWGGGRAGRGFAEKSVITQEVWNSDL